MSFARSNPASSVNALSPSAIRRLHRDLRTWETERHELNIPAALNFIDDKFDTCSINFRPTEGPFQGQTIHLHAHFPSDYPSSPPTVRMMTPGFQHPNVFAYGFGFQAGAYICLDMIKPPEYYAQPYSGWSAAYDLTGVVLQLYSFLIGDDKIDQEYGGSVSRASYRGRLGTDAGRPAVEFKCRCGFTEVPCMAPAAVAPSAQSVAASSATAAARPVPPPAPQQPPEQVVPELPDDVMGLIVSHADMGTIAKMAEAPVRQAAAAAAAAAAAGSAAAGRHFATSGDGADPLAELALRIKQEREIVCFYHKTPGAGSSGGRRGSSTAAEDDEDVLGFGVTTVRHRDGAIKSLSMAMDLLSYGAFLGGVRKSAWNVPFDAFVPLALNERHSARALRVLPSCVAQMLPASSATCGSAPEDRVLEVVARLMNSLVVEMVMEPAPRRGGGAASGGYDPRVSGGGLRSTHSGAGGLSRHMSDAALKGFCHLHHLLLTVTLAGRSPGALVARCQHDVLRFVDGGRDGVERNKSRCPDLGVLLIKYVLVPKDVVPWSAFAPAFVRELLARHVLWVGRGLGDGSNACAGFLAPWRAAGEEPDMWRLESHLKHSRTSLATVATEAFFVNALARPAGGGGAAAAATAASDGRTVAPVVLEQLAAIKSSYDKRNGEPPAAVFDAFSRHARSVLSISKWTEVLAALRLGLSPPPLRPDGAPTTVGDLARRMADTLRQAVLDSRRLGYHTEPRLPPAGGTMRAQPALYVDWEAAPPVGVVSDDWR